MALRLTQRTRSTTRPPSFLLAPLLPLLHTPLDLPQCLLLPHVYHQQNFASRSAPTAPANNNNNSSSQPRVLSDVHLVMYTLCHSKTLPILGHLRLAGCLDPFLGSLHNSIWAHLQLHMSCSSQVLAKQLVRTRQQQTKMYQARDSVSPPVMSDWCGLADKRPD